ncbi:MAG TPA: prolyl oligopeptidase family serine peptidase [Acidimicrobiales bacterium]|nr:prolyl oligopeptidase family serine peptidase [Acidimicrobiales bacterium]
MGGNHRVIEAPYGSWPSPISASMLVEGAARIDDVVVDSDGSVYWCEARPAEGGRSVIVRRDGDGARRDVTPPAHNVRTRVHEYGGGGWYVSQGTVVYSNFRDQRLWRIDGPRDGEPTALTAAATDDIADRFADGRFTRDGEWYVCVRERHAPSAEPLNELVAVATDGSLRVSTMASGADFYSSSRQSGDGTRLAWVQWNHPDMPWDSTELWVAEFADGTARNARRVAGGDHESIVQPEWTPDGSLYFCSDRNDWWNLYRLNSDDTIGPVVVGDFEIATPPWGFGQSRYVVVSNGVVYVRGRADGDVLVDESEGVAASDLTAIDSLVTDDGSVVFVGASYDSEPALYRIDGSGIGCLYRPRELGLDAAYLPRPKPVSFPSGDATAHALYYAPASATHVAPKDEKPPLIVMAHGGPTGAARTQINLALRYWTSRGFAVVDVNYRGSTGYGRQYRRALDGAWGIADVDDCIAAVRHLVAEGTVDGSRVAIRGGSAGGFTVLAALAFHPGVFAAGASHYGIADLEALARDTHKFESRYLDRLVGPYPQARDVYLARSPIHHLEGLATPLIVLQGLDDEIVPPNQAQMIIAALAARGLTHAYLEFEGEGHGFRQGPSIIRALEAEAYFYSQVFGFDLGDPVAPVMIENAPK